FEDAQSFSAVGLFLVADDHPHLRYFAHWLLLPLSHSPIPRLRLVTERRRHCVSCANRAARTRLAGAPQACPLGSFRAPRQSLTPEQWRPSQDRRDRQPNIDRAGSSPCSDRPAAPTLRAPRPATRPYA